jgi:aspartate 1-decarboxylase
MKRILLNSKIHQARVTDTSIDYEGSITIDEELMKETNMLPFEQVQVYNISNGERFVTYTLKGKKGSGEICINGAAARKASKGDLIIIASYTIMDEEEANRHQPKCILVDSRNRKIKRL